MMSGAQLVNVLVSFLVGLVVICVLLIQEMRREHTELLMIAVGLSKEDVATFRENKLKTHKTMEDLLTKLKENEVRQNKIEDMLSQIVEKIDVKSDIDKAIADTLKSVSESERNQIDTQEKLTELDEKFESHSSKNYKIMEEVMLKLYENENKQEEMKYIINRLENKVEIQMSKENNSHTYVYNDQQQHERCKYNANHEESNSNVVSLVSITLGFVLAMLLFAVVWLVLYKHPFEGKQHEAGSFLLTTVVISAMHSLYYLYVVFQAAVGYIFS